MRLLTIFTLAVLATGAAARADDKPEDRAKSAAEAFLKALKSKDVPTALKAADVPFLMPDVLADPPKFDRRLEKADAIAPALNLLVEKWLPTSVGKVQSLAAFKKEIGAGPEGKDPLVKAILEVGGDDGVLVYVEADGKGPGMLLFRVKGESAKLVGVLPVAYALPTKKE